MLRKAYGNPMEPHCKRTGIWRFKVKQQSERRTVVFNRRQSDYKLCKCILFDADEVASDKVSGEEEADV